jgi:hypothetical protein
MRGTALILTALLVSACNAEDPYLQRGEPSWDTPPATPLAPPPPVLPPLPPAGPSSPWGALDPGDLPDVRFVVAWNDWDCDQLYDGDGLYDPGPYETYEDFWAPCPARYAIIDLRGQVLVELDLPDSTPDDPWMNDYGHLDVVAAGPGKFIAVAERYFYDYGDSADGFAAERSWEAWLIDAYTGQQTVIALWDWMANQVYLPQAQRFIDLGLEQWGNWIRMAGWPTDDRFLLWSGPQGCGNQELKEVRLVDPFGPAEADTTWKADDLVPEDLQRSKRIRSVTGFSAGIDELGTPRILMGLTQDRCHGDPDPSGRVMSWSEHEGAAPLGELPLAAWPGHTTFAAHRGGGALAVVQGEMTTAPSWRWELRGADYAASGAIPDDRWEPSAGPLLDPLGPTFALVARRTDTWTHAIDFLHEGERVWSIDHLTFGLQPRNVYIRDVVLLPLVPQP